MTCWIVARWLAAAWRNASFSLSSAFRASAHSSDRNCTDTAGLLWMRSDAGEYRRGGQLPSARSRSHSPPRSRRVGEVRGVGEEPRAPLLAADHHGIEARVLGQEEHVLVADTQDVAEVGVDHASVRDHHDVALGVGLEDRLDGRHASPLEVSGGLAAGRPVPRRVLVAEQIDGLRVLGEDLLEGLALPLAAERLAEVVTLDDGHADAIGEGLRGLAGARRAWRSRWRPGAASGARRSASSSA